jgi:hypothetical protein
MLRRALLPTRRARTLRRRGTRLLGVAALLLALPLLGAGACNLDVVRLGVPTPSGVLPVSIPLPASTDPGAVTVAFDGADVTARFAPGAPGLVGSLPLPTAGSHEIAVTRPVAGLLGLPLTNTLRFEAPTAAPALLSAEPVGPAPRSAWIRLRFAAPLAPTDLVGFGFSVACDGARLQRSAHPLDDGTLILDPRPALPAGTACRVVWRGPGGDVAEADFAVAPDAAGPPAVVLENRTDPLALPPFPDDYWSFADASRPSGRGIAMPVPPFTDPLQHQAFQSLLTDVDAADGWSRQSPIVLAFSQAVDPSAAPAGPAAAQDPFAPIAVVDVDPASPDYGRRLPYDLVLRSDPAPGGSVDHVALLFPTVDLREQGHYAVVVTRRIFAAGEPGRPFGPSPFFAAVLAPPVAGEAPEITRARAVVAPALAAVSTLPDVPIALEDVAQVVSISVRTQPGVDDLTHIKELALASPPPPLVLPDLATDPCPDPDTSCIRTLPNRALEVRGWVELPDFRGPTGTFQRDPVSQLPVQTGTRRVPFVMTLPRAALQGPVIPVMYQHGNPGSPLEVLGSNNEPLDDAGFAVLGIQDTLNHEIGQDVSLQVQVLFFLLTQTGHLADYWNQTGADMIFFLRAIQGMGGLDLMHPGPDGAPALGPDGIPEIDPSTILYKGISEGANNAQRFLPFAPEILAAEATVGGARLGETLIHQSASEILAQIGGLLPQLHPVDLWVGLALFQADFDPQDGHTYLRYLYRDPLLPFAGSTDTTPPSTIWTEGLGDSLVPNNASRAMAAELGIPQVGPPVVAVPTLEQVPAPLSDNIAPGITAGYFQFDPATTPSCVSAGITEGHYCPQSGSEPKAQRLHFLLSALAGHPEIVDPF